jgi:DNA modification methylase
MTTTNTTLLHGDCLTILPTLPANSVHCCVTSPPYWGLRNYGCAGQLGLEPTPEAYVANMVAVFREVHRVLRDDGTLWLNLGDSYAGQAGGPQGQSGDRASRAFTGTMEGVRSGVGLKPKDLVGIPWRVAFALQSDGWFLRQDIIWHKPNPMPESVTDRCTKSHEYVFLLSKSDRYYYDAEAIKEPVTEDMARRAAAGHTRGQGKCDASRNDADTVRPTVIAGDTRNRRSVWTVPTAPYREAHFATFPPALITPMILAGCPTNGTVLDPFGGSGTTGQVAESLGRNSILIELNPSYIELQKRRTAQPYFAI